MNFLADLSRELVCLDDEGRRVRFDPAKATLIWRHIFSWDTGTISGSDEEYYFVTKEQSNIVISFPRRGWFRKRLGPPVLSLYNTADMVAHLALANCPLETVEKYFGLQEVK